MASNGFCTKGICLHPPSSLLRLCGGYSWVSTWLHLDPHVENHCYRRTDFIGDLITVSKCVLESVTVMAGSKTAGRQEWHRSCSWELIFRSTSRESSLGTTWVSETLKPASGNTSSTKPYLLILPNHLHQSETKHQIYEPLMVILIQTTTVRDGSTPGKKQIVHLTIEAPVNLLMLFLFHWSQPMWPMNRCRVASFLPLHPAASMVTARGVAYRTYVMWFQNKFGERIPSHRLRSQTSFCGHQWERPVKTPGGVKGGSEDLPLWSPALFLLG